MNNTLKFIGNALLIVAMVGCSTTQAPVAETKEVAAAKWSIQQALIVQDRDTGAATYVFCKADDCEAVTPKYLLQVARQGQVNAPARRTSSNEAKLQGPRLIQIPFSYDSDRLTDSGIKLIGDAIQTLAAAKTIEIVGLADSLNRDKYNMDLAARRAKSVKSHIEALLAGKPNQPILSTDKRIVRVAADGTYPDNETHQGRRVDIGVNMVIITK